MHFTATFWLRPFIFAQATFSKPPSNLLNQEASLMYKFTQRLQSCIAQFQGISSWLLLFNNLSKDWCWGRWPFQWYIIHHQCGLCPLQWWEWCGSMNIYSWANVGGTRLVSRQHTQVCTHTHTPHTLMCDRWWHQCPGAVTSLTASILVYLDRSPKQNQKKDTGRSSTTSWQSGGIPISQSVNQSINRSISQSINAKRVQRSNRGGLRQDGAISD